MASFTARQRTAAAVALACFSLTVMAGCSSTVGTATPSPTATATAPLAVTIPMPDIGPSPTAPPLSPEEKERQRVASQDALWGTVLATYPTAQRPEVSFTEYLTDDNRLEVRSSCFAAAGLKVETGSNADGVVLSVSPQPTNEAEAVSAFVCDAEHPNEPFPLPNDAVLSWVYDYLTQFLAPCYAANGVEYPAPPTKEDFVAQWPNQNWFPSIREQIGMAQEEAIYKACPTAN
ncbi:hypothetical protein AB4Y63_14145 [Leifsonia sp. YAF41]|uniref:hypothetical protein n=1 Tax=Leifsonia sp. YAF41 TaxID=3233086 RepID=UPI003F9CDE78